MPRLDIILPKRLDLIEFASWIKRTRVTGLLSKMTLEDSTKIKIN